MLETILAISGKPGLYRLVNRGNRSLIVETLDAQKKRMPAFGTDKIISPAEFMAKALPNYDRDHVYPSDMKKLVQWYNILIENGITDFEEEQAQEETAE